jgi:hypothetical protein
MVLNVTRFSASFCASGDRRQPCVRDNFGAVQDGDMFSDHDGPLPVRDGSLIAPFLTEMGPIVWVGLDLQHQLSQRGSGRHVVPSRHVRHFHRHLDLIVFPSSGEPQFDGLIELRYGMTPRHLVQIHRCQGGSRSVVAAKLAERPLANARGSACCCEPTAQSEPRT